ncbi:hypothetical protein [Chromobacterium phragmitis]|uniref:hypothetical protein n=1 Tax=Chromobacterium phragmitis TaxID=2202141 RepID=UPI0011AEA797|nr:hypothetical protein [Chromobacterium phragmitis]
MNKIFRDGLWVVFCALALVACGGGGGGGPGGAATANSHIENPPVVPVAENRKVTGLFYKPGYSGAVDVDGKASSGEYVQSHFVGNGKYEVVFPASAKPPFLIAAKYYDSKGYFDGEYYSIADSSGLAHITALSTLQTYAILGGDFDDSVQSVKSSLGKVLPSDFSVARDKVVEFLKVRANKNAPFMKDFYYAGDVSDFIKGDLDLSGEGKHAQAVKHVIDGTPNGESLQGVAQQMLYLSDPLLDVFNDFSTDHKVSCDAEVSLILKGDVSRIALRRSGVLALGDRNISYAVDGVIWQVRYQQDGSGSLSLIFDNVPNFGAPLRANFLWKGNALNYVSFESGGRSGSCSPSKQVVSMDHYPSKMSAILLLKHRLMTPGKFLTAFYCHESVEKYGAVAGRNDIYFDEKGDLRFNSDLGGGKAYVARYSSGRFNIEGVVKIQNGQPSMEVGTGGDWLIDNPQLRDLNIHPWVQLMPDEDKKAHNMAGVCSLAML